jgi:hypothetical protein
MPDDIASEKPEARNFESKAIECDMLNEVDGYGEAQQASNSRVPFLNFDFGSDDSEDDDEFLPESRTTLVAQADSLPECNPSAESLLLQETCSDSSSDESEDYAHEDSRLSDRELPIAFRTDDGLGFLLTGTGETVDFVLSGNGWGYPNKTLHLAINCMWIW